ncbi:MAG: amidohydrolase family protein, partial [Pseudomonadota bacterium]|nr:amidohydrolase family protein [Pseudomonadota bacterium]
KDEWIRGLPIIDVHCHVFNSRDIPAIQFITKVYLPNHVIELKPPQRRQLEQELARLLANRLKATPGYDEEMVLLRARLTGADDFGAGLPQLPMPKYARGNAKSCYGNDLAHSSEALSHFTAMITGYRHKIFEALVDTYRSALPGVEVALYTPALVDMMFWLERDAVAMADGGGASPQAAELTEYQTTLEQQVNLMEMLILNYPGQIHPFVPFCPWRQVSDSHHNLSFGDVPERRRKTALEIVEDAILNRGFLGVKLYPPMGFRPIGNASIPLGQFPSWAAATPYADRFGEELDRALMQLYKFCADFDVPIMAHTSNSNGAGFYENEKGEQVSFAERADPRFWEEVLALPGMGKLRLNMAHFGSGTGAKDRIDWRDSIGRMMDAHDNVYADLSHFQDTVQDNWLGAGQHCQEAAKLLEPIRKAFLDGPRAHRWKRLMYGSDWEVLAKEFYYADYLPVMAHMYRRKIYGPGIGAERAARGFMSGNAVRFLGLGRGERTRERLDVYYAKQRMDARLLARFDAQE